MKSNKKKKKGNNRYKTPSRKARDPEWVTLAVEKGLTGNPNQENVLSKSGEGPSLKLYHR